MNFFTVDVEDWFQAGVMQKYLRLNPSMANQHRLEENLVVLLDMLDSYGYQGTFFCLGNLVGKYASLLKLIVERGHEVASHGMTHTNLTSLDAKTLEWELKESKRILEDTVNQAVRGFRAPNFSITDAAIYALGEAGYEYDSSVFPITGRKGYGKLNELPMDTRPYRFENGLLEYPLTTTALGPIQIPIAGGAYFRHFPFEWLLKRIDKAVKDGYFHVYIHPWEIDEKHPLVGGIRALDRIRHYRNLDKMQDRIQQIFSKYSFNSINQNMTS